MPVNQREFAYRSAAAEGATQIGVLTLAYDGLARDLKRAAEAVGRNDIAARCKASNHALLLLGHLEDWVQYLEGPQLCASLSHFYLTLRVRILQLQESGEAEDFEALASNVLETRATWQRKEQTLLEELSKHNTGQTSSAVQSGVDRFTTATAWSA